MDVSDGYSTHVLILQDIIKNYPIQNAIEFGMGYYSTPIFIDNGCKLTSIEMHQREFFLQTSAKHSGKADFHLMLGEDLAVDYLKTTSEWDMVFVDGHEKSRDRVINEAFKHTQMIMCHDSEAKIYNWGNVVLPLGWRWYDITQHTPWTAVITCWDIRQTLKRFPYKRTIKMAEKEYLY